MDNEDKDKFVIMDLVPTPDEKKQMYMCLKCWHLDYYNYLTDSVSYDEFNGCIHSNVIWGDLDANIDVTDNAETNMIEVVM